LRQSHLDDYRIWPLCEQRVRQIRLPRMPVKVTHNQHETLSFSTSQKGTHVNLPFVLAFVHLDRRDSDSPLCQRLCHSPCHLAGGDGAHPVDLHDSRIIPDAHRAISLDGSARSDKTDAAIGNRPAYLVRAPNRKGVDSPGRLGQALFAQAAGFHRCDDRGSDLRDHVFISQAA
jgi:hypothetical protein